MQRPGLNLLVLIILYGVMLPALVIFGIVDRCAAQSDDKTVLALAQCLAAECDACDRGEEKAAIAWVLWKGMERYNANPRNRRKRSFKDQIRKYCAVFDKTSVYYYGKRARRIRSARVDDSFHLRDAWSELLSFSERFVSPDTRPGDPYPAAIHFGEGLRLLGKYCNKRGKWCTYIWGVKR